jgi:hypothetical protein
VSTIKRVLYEKAAVSAAMAVVLLCQAAGPRLASAKELVDESQLSAVLRDPEAGSEALERYFEVDESEPFHPKYRLKDEVEVVATDQDSFRARGAIIAAANKYQRMRRLSKYRENKEKYRHRMRLVSEGDSWFQHPKVDDIIDNLTNHYNVFPLAGAGHELRNMFRENEYLPALRQQQARVFLISGGGNDLLGERFGSFLLPYKDGATPTDLIANDLGPFVGDLMNTMRAVFQATADQLPGVLVVVHGYDHAIPQPGSKGEWLGKAMREKGITDQELQRGIVKEVIDRFNVALSGLAGQFDNVAYVDLRGSVRGWYDEIHPDEHSFQQIALTFMETIRRRATSP